MKKKDARAVSETGGVFVACLQMRKQRRLRHVAPNAHEKGFKKCDGGIPCDTCVRNKTPDLCQQPAKKKNRRESQPFQSVRAEEHKTKCSEPIIATRKSERARKQLNEIVKKDKLKGNEHYTNSNEYATPAPEALMSAVTLIQLSERDLQDSLGLEESHRRNSTPSSESLFVAGTRSLDKHYGTRSSPPQTANQSPSITLENMAGRTSPRGVTEIDIDTMAKRKAPPSPSFLRSPTADVISTSPSIDNADADMEKDPEASHVQSYSQIPMRPRRKKERMSYAEGLEDDERDRMQAHSDASDSDEYTDSTTDDENEEDEDVELTDDDENISEEDDVNEDIRMEVDTEVDELAEIDDAKEVLENQRKKKRVESASQPKAGKGIDLSLPPLNSVEDCFADLTANGLLHGLAEALVGLGDTCIKVATMCSGTEAPLLALGEISKGWSYYHNHR